MKDTKSDPLEGRKAFAFGGFHFVPAFTFAELGIADNLHSLSKSLSRDPVTGLNNYGASDNWNYDEFYKKSGDSDKDIFRCVETGRFYVPAGHELFLFSHPSLAPFEKRQTARRPGKVYTVNVHHDMVFTVDGILASSEEEAMETACRMAAARDPETASCEGVSSCVTDTRALPSDITVDDFRCHENAADILDSMQLDSGQEFVSLEGHCGEVRFRIRVHVVGDVRVTFRDERYRHASDMPEELRDSYRGSCDRTALALSDGGTYDTPYRCDNNNWFEVEMEVTCGRNDPEMPFAPDFIDVPENNSPEGWKAYLLDIVKDTLTEPAED